MCPNLFASLVNGRKSKISVKKKNHFSANKKPVFRDECRDGHFPEIKSANPPFWFLRELHVLLEVSTLPKVWIFSTHSNKPVNAKPNRLRERDKKLDVNERLKFLFLSRL